MAGPASWVVLATGWRRALLAVAAGSAGALAMPPFGLWPALVVALAPAIWLLDGAAAGGRVPALGTAWRAAVAGWFWGFGYFVSSLWWLGAAFLVQPDEFLYLMPFAIVGLPAALALFPALAFAAARLVWSPGSARIVAFAAAMAASEWLRGHLFTGFPWNLYGMALGQNLTLMQTASLVDVYGLTLLALLVFAAPATIASGEGWRRRFGPTLAATLVLVAMAGYGTVRLARPSPAPVPGVRLRIMQPNLAQDAKFGPAQGPAILRRYLDLSNRATSPDTDGMGDVTHLVWPESAFPFLLDREAGALSEIARSLPRGRVLITGAARADDPLPGETGRRFFNAIQAVAENGAVVATYDKVHLVPFGEYVPAFVENLLRSLGIRQFVAIPGGFTPGARHLPMTVPGLPLAAASVCYEAIFPGEILSPGPRPRLILNVTNDGWFGDTPGPRQHFAQARLRAVELGLPLVRAANTGISAVVDPLGRIVKMLPVGQAGVLDSPLPGAGDNTISAEFGGATFAIGCILCTGVAWQGTRRQRTRRDGRSKSVRRI